VINGGHFQNNHMKTKEINSKPAEQDVPIIGSIKAGTIFDPVAYQHLSIRLARIDWQAAPHWGKMSVNQMLNHIKVATGSGLLNYELSDESNWLNRNVIKQIAIYLLPRLPRNAAAPAGFSLEANVDHLFAAEQASIRKVLHDAYLSLRSYFPHPLFSNMNRADWGRLVYRHVDHHLRQFGY
jgi:hypothetical protein